VLNQKTVPELEKNAPKDQVICDDARNLLGHFSAETFDCCVTSPPYFGLRDYGVEKQIGRETSATEYVDSLTAIFRSVGVVLKKSGTLWVVIGDSYNAYKGNAKRSHADNAYVGVRGHPSRPSGYGLEEKSLKPKDLIGIPWMLAFALRADGWYLRQEIIWHKPNAMPESIRDRCTKSHETIFMFAKQPRYYYDANAIREPCSEANIADFQRRKTFTERSKGQSTYGEIRPDLYRRREEYMPKDFRKNKRDVWIVNTRSSKNTHFATYPESLITPCILAGCPPNGVVLDPFFGAGTTGIAATKNNRHYVGIDINPNYCKLAKERIKKEQKQPFHHKPAQEPYYP
jgi:DNA modification methylase